jgi:hypothetical protein
MSSKLDKYTEQKQLHASMIEQAYKAQNIHQYQESRCDKYGLTIGGKWHDRGEHMGYLTGHRGYYGNSGCTYECTPRLAEYLLKVINERMQELVDEAIELSAKDLEKFRTAAQAEAEKVLLETAK